MKAFSFSNLFRLFVRLRYPVALPEEIAEALGIELSNDLAFSQFVSLLTSSNCQPTRLCRFMPRQQVEDAFKSAQKKERFKQDSLYSYYFNEGWLEFVLQFDTESRLRRIYVQHHTIKEERGIEIPLGRVS